MIGIGVSTAALLMVSGCSLLLDFGDNVDADASPGNGGADAFLIPPERCTAYEDNNEYNMAKDINQGEPVDAALCSIADRDFYRFNVAQTQQVTINLAFAHALGDLNMTLYDPTAAVPDMQDPLQTAESQDDNEVITLELTANDYVLEVDGVQAENVYTLTITAQ